MPETQHERRTLRYDFSASETHDLSIQLANKTKEMQAVEEEKSSVTSQYGARLKEIKATCNKLSNQVTDGYEFRDVDVDIDYHEPEQGRKKITRKDNGKSWDEKMEDFEWNLFNQADETDHDDLTEENEETTSKKTKKKKTSAA